MNFAFDKKLFLFLSSGFILFTAIGTLSHESGHYLMARFLGYPSELHYSSTYTDVVIPGTKDSFIITLAGTLQTLFTGTLGVILLIIFRKEFSKTELKLKHWTIIFLSLFWLRQIFNLLLVCLNKLIDRKLFDKNDEMNLSNYLNLQELSISIITAILALIVFIFVLRTLPKEKRFTFLVSLCIGSLSGYIIWMLWLGPFILP